MTKGQHSSLFLLVLLIAFLTTIYLTRRPEPKTTTTTTIPNQTTTLPTTTTTTPTTTSVNICIGTNIRVCNYALKYECSIAKCCYWDLNISKCRPKNCSEIEKDYCVSCGCTLSQ